jgi:hypothetical protein
MRKRGKSINQFTINGRNFSIRLTDHASIRISQRHLDIFQITGAILSLGQDRIISYQNSNRDILIQDKANKFAVVIAIECSTITIITVIDSADCWSKQGTDVINL